MLSRFKDQRRRPHGHSIKSMVAIPHGRRSVVAIPHGRRSVVATPSECSSVVATQFPANFAKAPRSKNIQNNLKQESKLTYGISRQYSSKDRVEKNNMTTKKVVKVEEIVLSKNTDLYCYHPWESNSTKGISPPSNKGLLIDTSNYTVIDASTQKGIMLIDDKSGQFIAGKLTRSVSKQGLGGKRKYKEYRDTIKLLQKHKPNVQRGQMNCGVQSDYKLFGNRKDPLQSGVIGEYAFNPRTPGDIVQQVDDGVRDIVLGMESSAKKITQRLVETIHFRNVQEKLLLETVGKTDKSIATQFSVATNYWSQTHIDVDYFFTMLSCLSKEESDNEAVMYYFVFPEYNIKIPMMPGDVIVFNPLKIHACTNCRLDDSYIFSAYVSQKTIITAGVRAGLDKEIK